MENTDLDTYTAAEVNYADREKGEDDLRLPERDTQQGEANQTGLAPPPGLDPQDLQDVQAYFKAQAIASAKHERLVLAKKGGGKH